MTNPDSKRQDCLGLTLIMKITERVTGITYKLLIFIRQIEADQRVKISIEVSFRACLCRSGYAQAGLTRNPELCVFRGIAPMNRGDDSLTFSQPQLRIKLGY